jgi:hypothetical protein
MESTHVPAVVPAGGMGLPHVPPWHADAPASLVHKPSSYTALSTPVHPTPDVTVSEYVHPFESPMQGIN